MKRKLLISGILGVMLVFGILVFTACPTDNDDSSGSGTNGGNTGGNGDNDGDNTGNNGDNTGGNNGDNNGGNTGDTRQEGVYIGIISFAGDAQDLTNGVPVLLNTAGKDSLISKLNSGYAISAQSGTALFYSVHRALANLKIRDTQYPANLDSVNVVTFTDGLDNGSTGKSAQSPIEEQTFDSDDAYTAYLSGQIGSRTIASKPITAYSVGIQGNDVTDTTKFQNDLAKIASAGKSQTLTDFENLQATFTSIANGLQIAHTSTTFTMKTTLLASGTKVRMTFDVTGTAATDGAGSAKYIEGTITRTGTGTSMVYTFGSITYAGGLGSSQGSGPITGTINGSEVNFAFTGVAGYTPATEESKVKQWLMTSGSTAWQVNSEYDVGGATNTQIEKRSSIIYLVLDASKSLNTTQIGQIRSAVNEFITSLYNQLNGSGNTGNDSNTDDGHIGGNTDSGNSGSSLSAPTGVSAYAESSGSIFVSWSSVSGAQYYIVYRSESYSGPYYLVGESTSMSFTDGEVSPNTTYYYKVSAKNSTGESPQSSSTSATTSSGSYYPDDGHSGGNSGSSPSAPTGLSAYPESSSSIFVYWNSVWGAQYYIVYRSESYSGPYDPVGESKSTSFTDAGVLPYTTTYYYKVSAVNSTGESPQSNYTSAAAF
jgi:hypothetical protein